MIYLIMIIYLCLYATYELELFVFNLPYKYWVTKDGKILRIKNMTSNHIQNCISMLEIRYTQEQLKRYATYYALTKELESREFNKNKI